MALEILLSLWCFCGLWPGLQLQYCAKVRETMVKISKQVSVQEKERETT